MSPKKNVPSFTDIEKSMTQFSGDDAYPLTTWFDEFEETALLMNWTDIEKLIYAKRLLTGTAKLFLRSIRGIKDYEQLKQELEEEFGCKLNSAAIHKKLSSRKMKKDETYQQYFLHMKECALHGNIEDEALMEYVIDGIQDSESNKSILYGASDLREFKKKLDIYKSMKEKCQSRPSTLNQPEKKKLVKRCFKCGDHDHETATCLKGIKCFRCNQFGHKATECTSSYKIKQSLNIRVKNTNMMPDEEDEEVKSPYKKIKINDVSMTAMIDTGSDVNLIRCSEVENIMDGNFNCDKDAKMLLTGIAGKEVITEGILNANVKIDDCDSEMKFHVVQDYFIPVTVILGNPILKDFEVHFTADGIFLDKITFIALPIEENKINRHEEIEVVNTITKTTEDYKPDVKTEKSNIETKILTESNACQKKERYDDPNIDLSKQILRKIPYKDITMKRRINTRFKMIRDEGIKAKIKAQTQVVTRMIKEVKDYNMKKDGFGVKESIRKIEEEIIRHSRKRKKVN